MKRVIIIGAGAAGLAAASKLVELGFSTQNITILEAQNRIGGRIHSIEEGIDGPQSAFELGAGWVHGVEGNVVHSIASEAGELNTEFKTLESCGLAQNVNFSFEDSNLTAEQNQEFWSVIENLTHLEDGPLLEKDKSLGDYFTRRYKEVIDQGLFKTIDKPTAWALFDWYHILENILSAAYNWMEVEVCGSNGQTHYRECPGDPLVTWKHGYHSLFPILMRNTSKTSSGNDLPLQSCILLNKAVEKVYWDATEQNKVLVHCEDGSHYESDYVIFTCSLGFLKARADDMFAPALPLSKRNTIEALGFGTVDRIYLKFEEPWWNSEWGGVSFLRRSSDRSLPEEWSENIQGFYTVRNNPRLLVGWITGLAAERAESLPDEQVLSACSDRLKKYVGSQFSYTEPIGLIRSYWHSNPYTRGSYSYRSIQSEERNAWACHLAEPLSDSSGCLRIFFAGEATHDHFYSTVHGAVESGWREAERIVAMLSSIPQN